MRDCFVRLYGNDRTKNIIGNAIIESRLPHALLIDGAEGSGKTTLSLEIAAALNCEHRGDERFPLPCGECNNCRRIREGDFVDVKHLRKQPDKATIGVGEVREFRNDMYLSTTESDYKIYIIDDAEKLTPEAQNSLLISLEEPPKGVIIMLLAEGTDKILTTIKSRAQYICMSRFTSEEILYYLKEKSGLSQLTLRDEKLIRQAAEGADGRIGEALRLTDPRPASEYAERREVIVRFIKAIKPGVPYSELYSVIADFPSKRQELLEVLEGITNALCDLITAKRGKCQPLMFTDPAELSVLSGGLNPKKLMSVYDVLNEAQDELSKNANLTSALTAMAMKIKEL